MAIDNDLLVQSSNSYLESIDRNIQSLNAQTRIQSDLLIRQTSIQEATQFVTSEVRQNIAGRIQNQAYMAYGTFQYDMQNLAGFTDSTIRSSLTTLRVAGGHAIQDVRGVARSAAQNVLIPAFNFGFQERGAPERRLGLFTSAVAGLLPGNIIRPPSTRFATDFKALARENLRLTGRAALDALNPFTDPFRTLAPKEVVENVAAMIGPTAARPGGVGVEVAQVLTGANRDVLKKFLDIQNKNLEGAGFKIGERADIMGAGAETVAIQRSAKDINAVRKELTQFFNSVSMLSREMGVEGPKAAQALRDATLATGNIGAGRNLLSRAVVQGQAIGMAPSIAIGVAENAVRLARNLGLSQSVVQQRIFQTMGEIDVAQNDIRNPLTRETVAARGGAEAFAQNIVARRTAGNRGRFGLLLAGAGLRGQDVTAESNLIDLSMKFSENFFREGGGILAMGRIRRRQMEMAERGDRTPLKLEMLAKFKAGVGVRNERAGRATLEDISPGGALSNEFELFLLGTESDVLKTTQDLQSRVFEIFGQDEGKVKSDIRKAASDMFRKVIREEDVIASGAPGLSTVERARNKVVDVSQSIFNQSMDWLKSFVGPTADEPVKKAMSIGTVPETSSNLTTPAAASGLSADGEKVTVSDEMMKDLANTARELKDSILRLEPHLINASKQTPTAP